MTASAPTRPKLRAKYDERRGAVIATAARLFAERGYRQASIDDLVEATGLQRGGLYHYIEGKQQLLLLIHHELMQPLLEQVEAMVDATDDPEEQLRNLLRVWVDHVAKHRDHMIVFTEERRLIESDPAWADVREARERFQKLVAAILARGIATGAFAERDRDVPLFWLLGAVNYMSVWLNPGGRLKPAQIADEFADLLVHGLRG